jgi:3-dehydroquinate dehydratase-1
MKQNKNLAKYLKTTKTKLLISGHDFKKTPSLTELKKKLNQMSKFSSNVKIVTTAKSTEDSTRVLQLYSKKENINLIAFTMGNPGRVSRILSLYLGSPYIYVSLGKPVAPGQFSLDEVKRIINLKN